MMHIDLIEAVWIVLSSIAFALTLGEYRVAKSYADSIRRFNGSARGVVARANVADERIRLYVQGVMLFIALPGIFAARETPLNLVTVAFLTIPPAIIINTLRARKVRRILDAKLDDELLAERAEDLRRLEERLNVRADQRANRLEAVGDDTNDRVVDIQARTP